MLTPLDWIIIAVYLLLMVAIGIACRGKQDSSADYFIAKGGLSGFFGSIIIGLSIAATFFSGISFLAYPAIVYRYGLLITVAIPTFVVCWVVLRFYFLPRYVGAGWTRPYEVLEQAFGPHVRTVAAVMFILLRIGWMATLIFAPTIAIMAAAGLDQKWFWPLVMIVGFTSTVYTTLGGIRGVIITDAIQMIVIIGGIAITLIYIALKLPVPVSEVVSRLHDAGRLQLWEPAFSLTRPLTFWAVITGAFIANMGSYVGDQMSLQRYLTSSSVAESSRSFLVNVIGVIIVILLLAAVGVALAGWYMIHGTQGLPASADQILPYFVARELPTGIAGLLLAAILAATMSSITSGINALAASLTFDFRDRSGGASDNPRRELLFARIASLVIGTIATLSAGLVAHLGQLFDISQRLFGLFLGPLAVALLLSVSRLKIKSRFVIAGLIIGCLAGWFAALSPNMAKTWDSIPAIDSLWVPPIASVITAIIALAGIRRTAALQPAGTSLGMDPAPQSQG